MNSVTVSSVAPTQICAAGNREFIHMVNADATKTIYLLYDGDSSQSLTVNNGMPLPPGSSLLLSNLANRNVKGHEVWAICSSGIALLKVQGVPTDIQSP